MAKRNSVVLNVCFGALADPTRRAIVARLTRDSATVGELAKPFDLSLPTISRHLDVLESAGLIHRVREGRSRRCTLRPERMKDAANWLQLNLEFWEKRFAALERHGGNRQPERDGDDAGDDHRH